ncbi:MAG: bifunctional nuclease family protein [Bacteroidales bacterium]|nr:bifunctional nuclease family protein [Bacteroidales bacterium]
MPAVEIEVANLGYPQSQGDTFNLILKEKHGDTYLSVIIGMNEAKYIIMEINHIRIKRPLPHDMLVQLCQQTGCTVKQVMIADFVDGIFYVQIHITYHGQPILLDARLSDAIIVAQKLHVPIFIEKDILYRNGFQKPDATASSSQRKAIEDFWNSGPESDSLEEKTFIIDDGVHYREVKLATATTEELKLLLEEAIDKEMYELAAEIDAELNTRPDYERK